MEEPTVLDYVKSLLMPWKYPRIQIPAPQPPDAAASELEGEAAFSARFASPTGGMAESAEHGIEVTTQNPSPPAGRGAGFESYLGGTTHSAAAYFWPWRSLLALALALLAQTGLEPPGRSAVTAVILYGLAAVLLVWAMLRNEWLMSELPEDAAERMPVQMRWTVLALSIPFILLAYAAFGDNRFTTINLILGLLALVYVIMACYVPTQKAIRFSPARMLAQVRAALFSRPGPSWGTLLIFLAVLGLALFFRFYKISSVPGEMFSDHAEKLLDVMDVMDGRTSIYFPRNTGREAFQFYLTAGIIQLLGTGVSYLSLKIGTILAGLLTLPYIYLLGREIGGKWVGLFAVVLAAMGYWPNVIARVGLRFPLYPLFLAPALYYLVRGLRRQQRNDFIWAGIALGIGLHGYSPFRVVPVAFVILVLLYLLHRQSAGRRAPALLGVGIAALVALVLFLPLLRYSLASPENMNLVGSRSLTRLSTSEHEYPAPPVETFFNNLWKSWVMPFWDDGEVWVNSIPGRPGLDAVTAALYFLGTVMVAARYWRKRHWLDLFLLVAVPLLMMPSILSLAFPNENPSINRAGGAVIPVFILAGIGLDGTLRSLKGKTGSWMGSALVVVVGAALLGRAAVQNYNLVFIQYETQYMRGIWNTGQIGEVIAQFANTIGTLDTAYVVPFPYWLDTRLVGIHAGYPRKDYALRREDLAGTVNTPGAKLFILKLEDVETLSALTALYPNGQPRQIPGTYEGRDFITYTVLP